jgi:PadR family transcriptional regulator PadR
MDNKSNYIRGLVELLILQVLSEGESYGSEISERIEIYSEGLIRIPVGTLYPTFYRLEEKGYIAVDQRIVGRRIRTYYTIHETGRAYFDSAIKDYADVTEGVRKVLDRRQRKEGKDKK